MLGIFHFPPGFLSPSSGWFQSGKQTVFITYISKLFVLHHHQMNLECADVRYANYHRQQMPQDRFYPYESRPANPQQGWVHACPVAGHSSALWWSPRMLFSLLQHCRHRGRAGQANLILLFNSPVVEQPRIITRSLFVLLGSLNEVGLALFPPLRSPQMDINHTAFSFFCLMSVQFWNALSENISLRCWLYGLCLSGYA